MIITTIRIERRIADSLNAYVRQLQAAVDRRPDAFPPWLSQGRVSAGAAVEYLLHTRAVQRERAARSKGKARQKGSTIPDSWRLPLALAGDEAKAGHHANGAADDASAAPTDDER